MNTEAHSLKTYGLSYITLMLLLGLTYFLQGRDLGQFNLAAAMGISVAKATIVLLFFMHLRHGEKLNKIYATVAGFWLMIMFTLSLADVLTRG